MSVNVASRISDVISRPRTQIFVVSEVAIAVRQGSMSHPIIPSVVRNGGCYGADTVTSPGPNNVVHSRDVIPASRILTTLYKWLILKTLEQVQQYS